jgi:outer membrane protein insertion porin family
MPTNPQSRRLRLAAQWAVSLWLIAQPAGAQVRVDALTEVRSIRFEGAESISKRRLESVLETRTRGSFYGLRVALGKLPFVPSPSPHLFVPRVLQEDVVRLRSTYASSGYFRTRVSYKVERDDEDNLLDITFVIDERRPTVLADVTVAPSDSLSPLPIPSTERKSWSKLERSVLAHEGRLFIVTDARKDRERLTKWWRNRGYPRATVSNRLSVDSVRAEVRLAYRVEPGSFARFGEVHVEGTHSIDDGTVLKQVAIEPGEPYSENALERARLNVQQLEIVRVVHVDVPALGPSDSTATAYAATTAAAESSVTGTTAAPGDTLLPTRVRITEADQRLVSGDLGYVTDAGLSTEARWTHRNLTGGGRSVTVIGLAQTGWLALVKDPDERYRLSVSLKQPAIFTRRTSGVLTPFIEHRDDTQDLSTQYGTNATLVYQAAPLKSLSLDYQIARRHVEQYRFGDLASGDIDLFTFLVQASQGLLDSLGQNLQSSTFTLSGSLGTIDDAANPRRGIVVRPAIQVTAPTAISSTAYWRADGVANSFIPLAHFGVFAARVRIGRLFPFGKSLPGPSDDPDIKFLQLRDASFTAGGTGDVRGWENRLLGPKVPDVRFETVGDSLVPHTEGYVPFGGFARGSFSLELRLPVPGFGPSFGSVFFLDGGRVWTNDSRFNLQGDPHGQERLFVATGAGLSFRTPVGPIEVSAGYKLNPSVLDLADAADVVRAGQNNTPIEDLPRHNSRRWQIHLAIGTSY